MNDTPLFRFLVTIQSYSSYVEIADSTDITVGTDLLPVQDAGNGLSSLIWKKNHQRPPGNSSDNGQPMFWYIEESKGAVTVKYTLERCFFVGPSGYRGDATEALKPECSSLVSASKTFLHKSAYKKHRSLVK